MQADTVYVLGHELLHAKEQGISYVIDATPKVFGKDWEKLKKVAEEVGDKVSIITGCTGLTDSTLDTVLNKKDGILNEEQFNLTVNKCRNDFNFELTTGYAGLKAGFIGEIIILTMNDVEKARLTAAVSIIKHNSKFLTNFCEL